MAEVLLTFVLFALAMFGLSIGLILNNRILQGSCGGIAAMENDGETSCGACGKKEAEMCPSEDEWVRIAQIAHPDPVHHR